MRAGGTIRREEAHPEPSPPDQAHGHIQGDGRGEGQGHDGMGQSAPAQDGFGQQEATAEAACVTHEVLGSGPVEQKEAHEGPQGDPRIHSPQAEGEQHDPGVAPHVAVDGVLDVHGIGHGHEPEGEEGEGRDEQHGGGQPPLGEPGHPGCLQDQDPGPGRQRRQGDEADHLLPWVKAEPVIQDPHGGEAQACEPGLPGERGPRQPAEGHGREEHQATAQHHGQSAGSRGGLGVNLPGIRVVDEAPGLGLANKQEPRGQGGDRRQQGEQQSMHSSRAFSRGQWKVHGSPWLGPARMAFLDTEGAPVRGLLRVREETA